MPPTEKLRVAVIGGGWAGIAAAVEATRRGASVTIFEMAGHLGGRARTVELASAIVDNGQHIMIGAYRHTLALMRRLDVDADACFVRIPLALATPEGGGLLLPAGAPVPAFVRAVLRCRGWGWRDRASLLAATSRWAARGFICKPELTVETLCDALTARVRDELIEPLCVAALNTPARQASAQVLLRVLKDALFSGPGSADLLLPRRRLSSLLPEPAECWLQNRGAKLRLQHRVQAVEVADDAWRVDGDAFDAVILAATAAEAARLIEPHDAAWAAAARSLVYQPIVTVYAHSAGARLPRPMLALPPTTSADASDPAQFVFDQGLLGGMDGLLAFVVSAAGDWVERGVPATIEATLDQARRRLGRWLAAPLQPMQALVEKRATFACTPEAAATRPAANIRPGLVAAADYVAGPYPATLEGAVRSGIAAVNLLEPLRQ